MSRSHHFHVDQEGNSITVNVGPSREGEIEVLVNGKVIAYRKIHGRGMNVLDGELPGEPAHPFRVLVREPHLVPTTPRCTLELDGVEQPMPERLVL
ncbi:hypothetical protein [Streptomyces sp. NPDC101150]|uniref:hypothetical protein n=1 Tax=Streptomyces sp. NPDC101150 TaxID=3366114 RepID=UPI00382EFEDE